MFTKSIRWRLQIWYGLLLLTVLTGFGFTAYQLERGRLFRMVDDELQRRVTALSTALRPPPHPRPGPGPGETAFDHPPPPRHPQDSPAPPDGDERDFLPQQPRNIHLPVWVTDLFDGTETNGFYYELFTPDGTVLAHSANLPAEVDLFPKPIFRSSGGSRVNRLHESPPPEPPQAQTRALYRQVSFGTHPGPTGVVGCFIAPELAELRMFGWWLTVVGAGVLLLGLAGGGWLAARALRPIENISATATKISIGDLSHRINIADTDDELGRLATVLNSTFARLEAAFAQQKQFASDAAHELRTPVTVILTQTQSALSRERKASEYRETVESCLRSAQRMRRLIESLLQLARLEAGQETVRRMQFDLSQVTRDCVESVRPLADERGVKIHCDIPTLACIGDPDRITQVLANLLMNAIQYNQPNGEVRVALRSQNGAAILTLSDTGHGIAPADLPHIFERFFRADTSRSGTTAHSGLGLAIAKAIVEAHGGTIEVSSLPGAGSRFTVRLPAPA